MSASVDMVRGELGSRGTPGDSGSRSESSPAKIMGLECAGELKLKDVARFSTHPKPDSEWYGSCEVPAANWFLLTIGMTATPITSYTSRIVAQACYLSGLAKINTRQERFRPGRIFYFMLPHTPQPSFYVDISRQFEKKMQAVKAFQSQLFDPKSLEPQTYLSVPQFLPALESLNRYYGTLIQTQICRSVFMARKRSLSTTR